MLPQPADDPARARVAGAGEATGVAAAVRRALAVRRATQAPLLPLALAMRAAPEPAGAGFALTYDSRRPAVARRLGLLEAAMLADFALGGALRTGRGGRRPMPTVTLTLRLDRPPGPGLVARAWGDPDAPGALAGAHAELRDGETLVGRASAVFSVAGEPGAPPLPWESAADGATQASAAETAGPDAGLDAGLDAADRADATLLAVAADTAGEHDRTWAGEVLNRLSRRADGLLVCTPARVLANRAGVVQGGVLLALAADAVGEGAAARAVAVHVAFTAPAVLDEDVVAGAEPLHRGRRLETAHVTLRQRGRTVASATLTLRSG